MAHALVLGGGFGGINAALELRRLLGSGHDVTLVDEGDKFRMGLRNLWAIDGRPAADDGSRPLSALEAKGIRVVRGQVQAINSERRTAVVGGKEILADGLIIALGARLAPEATPGFPTRHNLYDPAGAAAFGKALQAFSGGRVLIQVCGMPFKCPPAPYEAALLAADMLHRRDVKAEVHLATPEPHPLPVAPPEFGNRMLPVLADAGVTYHPGRKPVRFSEGAVEFEGGEPLAFDLVAAVPVHKAPAAVEASGLTGPSGYVPVDAKTMSTKAAAVYAVGDVCAISLPNGKLMPKAGVLAESQGRCAATHLAGELTGRRSDATFDGKGTCFIETGNGKAIPVDGDFLATPHPRFTFRDASKGGLHEKEAFEAERLKAWFSVR